MYENEADKETMLVTIGEYKELVRKSAEISVVAAILKSGLTTYATVDALNAIFSVE